MNLWPQAERWLYKLEEIHPLLARTALSYASLGKVKVRRWEDHRIWVELSRAESLGEVLSAAETAAFLLWRRHENEQDLRVLEARIQNDIPLENSLWIRYEVSETERENIRLQALKMGADVFSAQLWILTPEGMRKGVVELGMQLTKGRYLP